MQPKLVLRPDSTLRQAMKAMTACHVALVMVADSRRRLLGVLTDSDLRRVLMKGADLSGRVSRAMNPKPVTMRTGIPSEEASELFRRTGHTNIPVVDDRGILVALANILEYAIVPKQFANRVVLMAGGQGRRLRPLTDDTPKPMLPVAGKPLLEHVLEQLTAAGFIHFIITINYLADKIRAHFGNGSRWNAEIEYISEPRPLGTAGALTLLPAGLKQPILVMNGDVLTKANFSALLDFHRQENALATVCVKRHEIQLPYGVIELPGRKLRDSSEKLTQHFLINAGLYVVEPRVISLLPKGRPSDMPQLLARAKGKRGGACFPLEEYWLDIGGINEFNRAADDFGKIFRR